MSLSEIRRKNLQKYCSHTGTQAEVAAQIGISASQISQLLTGRRNIGEKLARKIERALHMPLRILDDEFAPHLDENDKPIGVPKWYMADDEAPAVSQVPPVEIIESLLAGAIDAFEHLGQKPDPRVLAQVVVDGLKRRENEESSESSPKQMIA